jgi:lipase
MSDTAAAIERFDVTAFLGPAVARLRLTFESREAYRAWWRAHPALADGSVADADLDAYADHDLTGEAPALRSSVVEECVLGPANDLLGVGETARRLAVPATLLCAERGLLDEPSPMQPLEAAQRWAADHPATRRVVFLPGLNHYTITLAERGASAVAEQITAALDGPA